MVKMKNDRIVVKKTHESEFPISLYLDSKLNNLSIGDYFDLILPFVVGDLIAKENVNFMRKIFDSFPASLTNGLGFECRLDVPKSSRNDFFISIGCSTLERKNFLDYLERRLPENFRRLKEWKNIYRFARCWYDPTSSFYDKILGFWFEFDVPPVTAKYVPNIFIIARDPSVPTDISMYDWFTKDVFRLLKGREMSRSVKKNFKKSIENLPDDTSIHAIGLMLNRSADVRICIKRIKTNQIKDYIDSINLPLRDEYIFTLLEEIKKRVNRFVLQISVDGKGISPYLGVECSFEPTLFHKEERWKSFLEYFVRKKLCTPSKFYSLLRFLGITYNNKMSLEFFGKKLNNAIVRYISHIKIACKPRKKIEVKAYLGAKHYWLPHESF